MKKLLMVALLALPFAGVSQAARLLCGSNVNSITDGIAAPNPINVPCGAIDTGAGNILTNISVRLLGSFNDGATGNLHESSLLATAHWVPFIKTQPVSMTL